MIDAWHGRPPLLGRGIARTAPLIRIRNDVKPPFRLEIQGQ